MNNITSAGIIVYRINSENIREYLLLKYAAGHWDFAKGQVENDETLEQAATRELKEEAGIEAHREPGFEELFSYYFTDYDGQKAFKTVHFFVGQVLPDQKVQLSDEHTDYVWLPYDTALGRLTYENAQKVLTASEEFLNTN